MNKIIGVIKGTKVYPELENLEVIPSLAEQNFTSNKYGYESVKVKAIDAKELNIVPSRSSQTYNEMYNKVFVKGENNLTEDNIRKNVSIFGIEGKFAGASLNIFLQENEPEKKEGLWLQASELVCENIVVDEKLRYKQVWEDEDYSISEVDITNGTIAVDGTNIYIFSGTKAYAYDTVSNTYTSKKAPSYVVGSDSKAFYYDGYVYILLRGYLQKYNLKLAYTTLVNPPYSTASGNAAMVGQNIFILQGGTSGGVCVYDVITQSYETYDLPDLVEIGWTDPVITSVGDDVYIFGGNASAENKYKYAYKFNMTTRTYTRLSDVPYDVVCGTACVNGTDIYVGLGTNNPNIILKYDTLTGTYSEENAILSTSYAEFANVDGTLYHLQSNKVRRKLSFIDNDLYSDNTVILIKDRNGYEIELVDTKAFMANIEGKITTCISDALHYTKDNGLNPTVPTYYGNGTEWVKFKN